MAHVETVRGPVETSALGRTLMHEHVFVLSTEILQNYGGEWWDEEVRVEDAVSKLQDLVARGITTVVDPTVIGLGRYIPRVQRIAEQVPDPTSSWRRGSTRLTRYRTTSPTVPRNDPGRPGAGGGPVHPRHRRGIADTGVKASRASWRRRG